MSGLMHEQTIDQFRARSVCGTYTTEIRVIQRYTATADGDQAPSGRRIETVQGLPCKLVEGEEGIFEIADLGIRVKDTRL